MFAYCRNNPVCRIDISGAIDVDSLDPNPVDESDTHEDSGQGGASVTGSATAGNLVSIVTNQLKACAQRALSQVTGQGPVTGTKIHTAFANEVAKLGDPNLTTETSYKNGELTYYGDKGSIRFDVLLYDSDGNPIAAWDLKTGSAKLTPSRIEQMQTRSGLNIEIYVVR